MPFTSLLKRCDQGAKIKPVQRDLVVPELQKSKITVVFLFCTVLIINATCWCDSYFMLFGVGASCILHSIVSYLYVSCRGTITSVGEERANFSAIFTCNLICGFCSEGVSSSSWCLRWHQSWLIIARRTRSS